MNYIRNLRIFGTIYLWIFVAKVLQVRGGGQYRSDDTHAKSPESGVRVRSDGGTGGGGVMIKPLTIQIFDDYTDELVNERGRSDNAAAASVSASPSTTTEAVWQAFDKHLYYNRLPLIAAKLKTIGNSNSDDDSNNNNNNYFYNKNNGNSMTSKAITFENLNDFGSKGFWPNSQQQQQQQQQQNQYVYDRQQPERRHSLIHPIYYSNDGERVDKQNPVTNIRYEILPLFMEKYFKTKNLQPYSAIRTTKTKRSKPFTTMMANNIINDNNNANDGNVNADGNGSGNGMGIGNSNTIDTFSLRDDIIKETLFPFKDDTLTLNVNIDDGIDGVENRMIDKNGRGRGRGRGRGNGNGNESLNYADSNVLNTNYFTAQSNTDIDRETSSPPPPTPAHHVVSQHINRNSLMDQVMDNMHDKRAKPSVGHTPFLPAVSGGAMTNLGKFFRDLSKNVHFSEQYQWSAEQQKLLEGDPNFSNIQYHLEKPNAAADQQTAEWIKAIRFYRPSQKIRSLVAMNPHGQWAHSSQFIDPNYMWVGLGK